MRGLRALSPVRRGAGDPAWALVVALVVAASAAWALHVFALYAGHTVDDAGISYAYARNLAAGHGLRLTPLAEPVEGFSNPLEVLLLAPFARLGCDLDLVAKLLNIIVAALGIAALGLWLAVRLGGWRRLFALAPVAIITTWQPFNYWTAAGLEGGLLAGLQLAALLLVPRAARRRGRADFALGLACGALAWCRPEGVFHGALALLARVLHRRARLPVLVFTTLVASLLLWRWLTFGELLPNTYFAKIGWHSDPDRGTSYVFDYLASRWYDFALGLPVLALLWPGHRRLALGSLAAVLFAFGFAAAVDGDWMRHGRLLQPAMAPFAVLLATGLAAVLAPPPLVRPAEARAVVPWGPSLLALSLLAPVVIHNAPRGHFAARTVRIAATRDVSLARIQTVAPHFQQLQQRLHVQRPLLHALVDVGGMAHPGGFEILDLGTLGDRVLARAFTRQSARVADYLFGERRPDSIHLHSSWTVATPVHRLWPFSFAYRRLNDGELAQMALAPVAALRADHVDPWAPPVHPLRLDWPGVRVVGLSAVSRGPDVQLTFHGVRREGRLAMGPAQRVRDRHGGLHAVDWQPRPRTHPGAPGSARLGSLVLPAEAFPVQLGTTGPWLSSPPLLPAPSPARFIELLRLPLLRRLGLTHPSCDHGAWLDPHANDIARLRGFRFLYDLCGGAPDALLDEHIARALRVADDEQLPARDRHDAAVASLDLGRRHELHARRVIEDTWAAAPLDEILLAWAAADFDGGLGDPARAAAALAMLVKARRYEDVIPMAFATGVQSGAGRNATCHALRALALDPKRTGDAIDCTGAAGVVVRLHRQSFEDAGDARLRFLDTTRPSLWLSRTQRPAQPHVVGGHGALMINTFDRGARTKVTGAVVYGPLRLPGTRFGVLMAGKGGADAVYVAVDTWNGQRWAELARLERAPGNGNVLVPRIAPLEARVGQQIRVRLVDGARDGYLLADAVTFIEVERP